ncbi:LysO family transporter [Chitinasiproducens palmae]|uniref:Lysine exporter LysO family protein n=1 Tax=Chitinasiproducens palmae TaxID=1770053 RepID=A0A1H2PWB9_9BURK|nr:LysO family transporter [Chitinasiproducens palmae]SDV51651.1 Membrane protein of unknown function [Chitinasiproducens palmae]
MELLSSLLPIVVALLLGAICGRVAPPALRRTLSRALAPLIAVLLFVAGAMFGDVFASPVVVPTLGLALCYAAGATLTSYFVIALSVRRSASSQPVAARPAGRGGWHALRECATALGLVAAGALLQGLPATRALTGYLPRLDHLVWLLVALVGIDLVRLPLAGAWRSPIVWVTPLLAAAASLLGGALAAWLVGERTIVGLALASGFGWFSMSGALVASRLGEAYGAIALSTDLFRELLAIVLLYSSGTRRPAACVAAAGATALDSTLPIIRQTCAPEILPLALFSGFVLSLLAPVLMAAFLAFA